MKTKLWNNYYSAVHFLYCIWYDMHIPLILYFLRSQIFHILNNHTITNYFITFSYSVILKFKFFISMPSTNIFYVYYEFFALITSNWEFRSAIWTLCYSIILWYLSALYLVYYKSFLVLNSSAAFNLKFCIYFFSVSLFDYIYLIRSYS